MKNTFVMSFVLFSCFLGCISCESNEPTNNNGKPFSVGENKKIIFSSGNLQYTQSTDTWSFASSQYEMIGEANIVNRQLADKIDLFGYSAQGAEAQWGISTSTSDEMYFGDFADWGQNIGDGKTWRTPSQEEWEYLINKRVNALELQGVACIWQNEDGSQFTNGLIFLPDDWECPKGIIFRSGTDYEYAESQIFSISQWKELEAAGAIFLPAAGYRDDETDEQQESCVYWSSTPHKYSEAVCLAFIPDKGLSSSWNTPREYGYAVRLVKDF
ncbi:MAG: hypothetical protein ACI3Z8_00635 [Paludibacteraceae bacterium]